MKPIVTSSSIVHENPWYRVRRDELIWPNGKPGQYFVSEFPGGVCLVCIKDEKILVVESHRHTVDATSIELPAGRVEPGEDPLETAKRELEEEAGIKAKKWKRLGGYYALVGAAHIPMHIFLAEDFEAGIIDHDDAETTMKSYWLDLAEWKRLIREGKIIDGESIASWGLYREVFET